MKTTLFISIFLIASIGCAFANERIACKTPTGSKSFTIENNRILSIAKNAPDDALMDRHPSNVTSVSIKRDHEAFTQTLVFEGEQHVVHIANTGNFNEVEDYLWVTSKEGHKFMYPITCRNI